MRLTPIFRPYLYSLARRRISYVQPSWFRRPADSLRPFFNLIDGKLWGNRLHDERKQIFRRNWVTKLPLPTKMSLNLEHRNKKVNDIHEGKWNGLGGKLEAGETPEECVIREVLEESGLSIQNPKLCGLLMFPKFKGNDWYVFVFTATNFTGELIDSPEGKLEWIPNEKILDLNLWESDHIFMPWIQEAKFFSAKFEYEGDKMCGHSVVFHL